MHENFNGKKILIVNLPLVNFSFIFRATLETYPIFPLISISICSLHRWTVVFGLGRWNGFESAWGRWLSGWRTDLCYFRWLNVIGLCSWIVSTGMINKNQNLIACLMCSRANGIWVQQRGDKRGGWRVTKLKPMCCMMKSRDWLWEALELEVGWRVFVLQDMFCNVSWSGDLNVFYK